MDRRQALAQRLMQQPVAAAPVMPRQFALSPEPVVPAGTPTMQAQSSIFGFDPVDDVSPRLRGQAPQTVSQTARDWATAMDIAGASGGMIAGPRAATANRAALQQAQEMLGKGADARSVWRETGWFQAGDGKWRFEIPDNAAALSGAADGQLGDVLTHADLYAAYPGLRDIPTEARIGPQRAGSFMSDPLSGVRRIEATAPTAEELRSILLHEVQHGVQRSEGRKLFAGSGPGYRQSLSEQEARAVQRRADYSPIRRNMAAYPVDDYGR